MNFKMVLMFKVMISLQVCSRSNNLIVAISSPCFTCNSKLSFVLEGQDDKPGAEITLILSWKHKKKNPVHRLCLTICLAQTSLEVPIFSMMSCSYLFHPSILMVHACSSLVLPCVFMAELDAGTNLKVFSFKWVDFLNVTRKCLEWSCIVFFNSCRWGARSLLWITSKVEFL